jgi:3-deoxy-manno-octulosonate cytidylyltransferase (CMP-KDO synthetase)
VPQKALAKINGVSMIRRVAERCLLTNLHVTVCTDSELIRDEVCNIVDVVLSDLAFQNGTARIADACKDMPLSEKIIDVQGDDPFVDPVTILDIAKKMEHEKFGCFVPYSISEDPIVDSNKKSIVKIIPTFDGNRVLYMSRNQTYHPDVPIRKHSSVIGFFNYTLQMFNKLPISNMELSESIELMRLIENNQPCYTWRMSGIPGLSVDTPDDLICANNR